MSSSQKPKHGFINVAFIPAKALSAILPYHYTGEDNSILVRLFLKRFWNWFLDVFIPEWMAPNLLTLIGFLCLVTIYVTSIWLCPFGIECTDTPRHYFLLFAFLLFTYQLMDNLDGKQARKTENSSALGELFDHGCDSLFLMLLGPAVFLALNYSGYSYHFYLNLIGIIVFFGSHWEEYFTDKLVLGAFANPTEIQWIFISVFVTSAFRGPQWWSGTLLVDVIPILKTIIPPKLVVNLLGTSFPVSDFLFQLNLSNAFFWFVMTCCLTLGALSNTITTFVHQIRTRGSLLKPFAIIIPFSLHCFFSVVWMRYSTENILSSEHFLFLALFNLIYAYLCILLITSRICKRKLHYAPYGVIIFPALGAINCLVEPHIMLESDYLGIATGLMACWFGFMVISIISGISTELNISVFTINKPSSAKKKRNEVENGDGK